MASEVPAHHSSMFNLVCPNSNGHQAILRHVCHQACRLTLDFCTASADDCRPEVLRSLRTPRSAASLICGKSGPVSQLVKPSERRVSADSRRRSLSSTADKLSRGDATGSSTAAMPPCHLQLKCMIARPRDPHIGPNVAPPRGAHITGSSLWAQYRIQLLTTSKCNRLHSDWQFYWRRWSRRSIKLVLDGDLVFIQPRPISQVDATDHDVQAEMLHTVCMTATALGSPGLCQISGHGCRASCCVWPHVNAVLEGARHCVPGALIGRRLH